MPNTREKLIELMQDTRANAAWHRWGYEESADYLIANGVRLEEKQATSDKASEWIPVTERLPENDYGKHWMERKYYIVRLKGDRIRVARYGYKEHGWWIDSHDCVLSKDHYNEVTHWMEAPQPPKGE